MTAQRQDHSSTDRPRKVAKAAPPYDPHRSTFDGERTTDEGPRLAFICPSRSSGEVHLLITDEDGGRASCSCKGYAFSRESPAACTHTKQAREVARLALTNHFATLPADALRALDCGGARGSLRSDLVGDEVCKRARMQDKPLLSLRARQAREELFG